MKYKTAILGGTFDHFHRGHKKLLDEAFSMSEKVGIGIATPELFRNKYLLHVIEDKKTRKENLVSYLSLNNYLERAEIIEINDVYGNTLDVEDIDAIFVTPDTVKNAEKINDERQKKGFKPLAIETVRLVLSSDNEPISSKRIRKGEIDRDGTVYFDLFKDKKRFIMPEDLREQLKKPIGKVAKNIKGMQKIIDDRDMLISIGDIVTVSLLEFGMTPDVSIFDYRTEREEISKNERQVLASLSENREQAENAAGTIERRAVGAINRAFKKYHIDKKLSAIEIIGEEDLLTIPALLLAPLGSLILYGQRNEGIVAVRVTEKKKREIRNILFKFQA